MGTAGHPSLSISACDVSVEMASAMAIGRRMGSGGGVECYSPLHHDLVPELQVRNGLRLKRVVDCDVLVVAIENRVKVDVHKNDPVDVLCLLDLLDHDSYDRVRAGVPALVRALVRAHARQSLAVWLLRVPCLRLAASHVSFSLFSALLSARSARTLS